MSHIQQVEFCKKVKALYPEWFKDKIVVDIGSLDINGNNRYLFENCIYVGVDIGLGRNVDIVSKGHEFNFPNESVDVVIATECFEHDMYYEASLKNIYRILKPGGFLIFTCATTGRAEHGTKRTTPQDATLLMDFDDWCDYYKNLTEQDISSVFNLTKEFSLCKFETNEESHDLSFYGFKSGIYSPEKSSNYFKEPLISVCLGKQAQIEYLDSLNNQLPITNYQLSLANQQLTSQNQQLTSQNQELTSAIQSIYNSWSWKITRPLRKLKSLIKKVRFNH